MNIFEKIEEAKVVPIYNDGITPDPGDKICEITMRHPDSPEIIKYAKANGQIVGAGTVLDANSLHKAYNAGADFCITPITNRSVIKAAFDVGIPIIPGAMTPNEILEACLLTNVIKVFPAVNIDMIIAPFRHLDKKFIATGCVNPDNYKEFLKIKGVMSVTGSSFAYRMKEIDV